MDKIKFIPNIIIIISNIRDVGILEIYSNK